MVMRRKFPATVPYVAYHDSTLAFPCHVSHV